MSLHRTEEQQSKTSLETESCEVRFDCLRERTAVQNTFNRFEGDDDRL